MRGTFFSVVNEQLGLCSRVSESSPTGEDAELLDENAGPEPGVASSDAELLIAVCQLNLGDTLITGIVREGADFTVLMIAPGISASPSNGHWGPTDQTQCG